jgi:hypothetical protein
MISILIPTFNYNIVPLVNELFKQASNCNMAFEILVYDDGSKSKVNNGNKTINSLAHCVFKELPKNIGRSAIRNLLAENSRYENLIFVDAGTFPKGKIFIENYTSKYNNDVIVGGMTHLNLPPKKPYKLRWLYTKKREGYQSEKFKQNKALQSSNFFIKKKIFQSIKFDESIKNYGCEDVVFFESLIKKNIDISHIDNPVIHAADDDANKFIKKTEIAIENLVQLINQNKISKNHYSVSKVYETLSRLSLIPLIINFYKLFRPLLINNFNSNYPSILLYDFYRLGHYCLIKSKK